MGIRHPRCSKGARRGDYSTDQCPVCWREINPPGFLLRPQDHDRPRLGPPCCPGEIADTSPPYVPPTYEQLFGAKIPTISGGPMVWSYGVTTVPERITDGILKRTLESIEAAGFPSPPIFCDGYPTTFSAPGDMIIRPKRLGAYGNWWLALVELYIREPNADRYAVFQDDVRCVKNLRGYLEKCPNPPNGYWNLYTARDNERLVREGAKGFVEATLVHELGGKSKERWQTGRGALALVFPRLTLLEILSSRHMAERPMDKSFGTRSIDGGVVSAANKAGMREFVHVPSLVQHAGEFSTIVGNDKNKKRHKVYAESFPGESFDAMDLLKK